MTSAVTLVSADDPGAAADRAVSVVRAARRARAAVEAAEASAVVMLADLCEDRVHESLEVAAVMCWTPRFADDEVSWCRDLIGELPEVFAAWRAGDIDRYRARIFVDGLSSLLAEHGDAARAIAAAVLPAAGSWTGPRLRNKLLRLVLAVDSDVRKKQLETRVAERDVWLGPNGDGGTATLSAFNLPAGRAAAAFERVDAIARSLRTGGDGRTLAQLRADTVLDLLDGTGVETAPIGRPGVLELQIPLATAIGTGDAPGELAGYGPVLADVARQIAQDRQDLQWRFTVTQSGELVYQGLTTARPEAANAGVGVRRARASGPAGERSRARRS